jgi:hypothetical protein
MPTGDFEFWVPLMAALSVALLWRHWRDRQAGLLFTYVVSFASIYLIAPALYLLPWHNAPGAADTAEGLRVSAAALAGLWVGAEVVARLLASRQDEDVDSAREPVDGQLIRVYLVGGAFLYAFVLPTVGTVTLVSSLVSTSAALVVIGFCLKCWNAWVEGSPGRLWAWLLAASIFPLATVVGQGYLGYGLAAAVTVVAFAASFYRPRWKIVTFGVVMAYAALSVYVTYMRDRTEIREAVWGQESLERRMDRVVATFSAPELFNVADAGHLERVEDRLNQDALIGIAVGYIGSGMASHAGGSTFMSALIAPIPRVLWPGKPVVAGSGELVSQYTGLVFAEGTSVGVGHVLEAYINFGMTGVVVVFAILGGTLVMVDWLAYRQLHVGNGPSFVLWYLPGLGLLQVGGSLSEATGFAAASWIMARVFNALAAYGNPAGGARAASLPSAGQADQET